LKVEHPNVGLGEMDKLPFRESLRGRGEDDELTSGKDSGFGGGEGGFHLVDGAEGDGVKLAAGGHGFDAAGPDFGLEGEGADGFAEEGGFLVLGFGEGDVDVGAEKGDGEAGKTCSGAEVEEGLRAGGEMAGGEETLTEVAANDLFGVADGGEIGAGVPLEEEIEVDGELEEEVVGWIRQIRVDEIRNLGLGQSGHGADGSSRKFGQERSCFA
jgi:hypothetical protein